MSLPKKLRLLQERKGKKKNAHTDYIYHLVVNWLCKIPIMPKSNICVSAEKIDEVGVIEADKDHVREEPYTLPSGFEWDTIDLGESKQVYHTLFSYFFVNVKQLFSFMH